MVSSEISLRDSIEDLLRESSVAARERERRTFDDHAGNLSSSLVLFGAGGIGRKTLAGLRKVGIEPLAFADNNEALWQKPINGVNVMSPREACARYGKSACFVVTIWCGEGRDRMRDRVRFLRDLGCEHVVTFGPLYWKYPDIFLPHYAAAPAHMLCDEAEAVLEAAELWSDEASKREYLSQIRWRLFFDFDGLADPVQHPIYFPSDLCSLIQNEVFVDCGAYDGDTLKSFLEQSQGVFKKAIAFEPDPSSFAKLEKEVAGFAADCTIDIHEAATGAENGSVLFTSDGTPAASMGTGTTQVRCVKLDDALENEAPTYIKMDIEGAELDALKGASRIIANYSPVLAVCSYHKQDHVWNIPRLIHSINPDYHFFLRPHLIEVWDLVCYAIPKNRLIEQTRVS